MTRHTLELRCAFVALAVALVGCSGGGGSGSSTSAPTTSGSSSQSPSASPSPGRSADPGSAIAYANGLRALSGLPALGEDTSLAQGEAAHALYMVKNNVIGHAEDAQLPFFTPEGDLAARNSNLAISTNAAQPDTESIDGWITGPFHAAGILDARLLTTEFSSYSENKDGVRYGACLDVLRGLGAQATVSFPVLWPGNGATVKLSSYHGNESPDPLSSTPGFTAPTGLPVYCLLGTGNTVPNVTASSFASGGNALTHAVFDETTYTNGDANAQTTGRAVLASRNMVVLIPRDPLTAGATYAVSLTVNGQTISWSFTVAADARN